jgi:hypothetical protein
MQNYLGLHEENLIHWLFSKCFVLIKARMTLTPYIVQYMLDLVDNAVSREILTRGGGTFGGSSRSLLVGKIISSFDNIFNENVFKRVKYDVAVHCRVIAESLQSVIIIVVRMCH